MVILPRSNNPNHIKENLELYDFEIEEEDMKAIEKLDQRMQYSNWPSNMQKETQYE